MQYTENYSLKLPGYGDNADVGDLNDNTTAIDALIHANRQIEAPAFSTDTAYTTGDMCVYENVLYKFTSDKAAGNWDSTKATATNLADEVTDAAQSGGTEVIANPSAPATEDLNKLQVENTVYGIPDPTVTKTATGNPIEFTDGADAPLVKCTTAITGSQDLHGYDEPWVGGAGKNKIPVLLSEVKSNNTDGTWSGDTYSYSGVTFKVESNSEGYVTKITVNASPSSSAFSFYLKRETITYATSMILNGCPSGGGDATYDLRVTGGYRDIGNGVTIPANNSFNVFWIVIRSGITVSNLVFQPMIRLSTVTDPTFEPYSNICPITAYNQSTISVEDENEVVQQTSTATFSNSIYQGNADFVGGRTTSARIVGDKSDLNGTISGNSAGGLQFIDSSIPFDDDVICNMLPTIVNRNTAWQGTTQCISQDNNGKIRIFVSVTDYADFATKFADLQFVYPNISTEQIAVSNLPIKSLFGYNHIESSTGDMEVEYITQTYQPIVDLIDSSKHVYSTAEQVVGKWVDGSDVYEKTIVTEFNNAVPQYTLDLSAIGGDTTMPIYVSHSVLEAMEGSTPIKQITMPAATNSTYSSVSVQHQSSVVTGKSYIKVRYIKLTSNNRSLSKGPSEESVDKVDKVDKVDEPTETIEEKKEVEEPTEKEENER